MSHGGACKASKINLQTFNEDLTNIGVNLLNTFSETGEYSSMSTEIGGMDMAGLSSVVLTGMLDPEVAAKYGVPPAKIIDTSGKEIPVTDEMLEKYFTPENVKTKSVRPKDVGLPDRFYVKTYGTHTITDKAGKTMAVAQIKIDSKNGLHDITCVWAKDGGEYGYGANWEKMNQAIDVFHSYGATHLLEAAETSMQKAVAKVNAKYYPDSQGIVGHGEITQSKDSDGGMKFTFSFDTPAKSSNSGGTLV